MRGLLDALIWIAKVFAVGVGSTAVFLLVMPWLWWFFSWFFSFFEHYFSFVRSITAS